MSSLVDTLETENVVASTSLEQELDLEALANDLTGVKYDPDNFPGLVYRTQNPKAAALIFRSGKVVCTGASSVENVKTALRKTFDAVFDLGIKTPDELEYTVQNIVTSGDLGKRLNLNAIAIGFGLEHVEYEPEQFPGLVYRADDLDVVVLLFGSGKIVITGATTTGAAENAITQIATRLDELNLLID